MRTNVYNQITHLHLEQQLWQKELDFMQQEITFFETVLNELKNNSDAEGPEPARFRSELHHYSRLVQRLITENEDVQTYLETGATEDSLLTAEQWKNYQYLREEMDQIQAQFTAFKKEIRTFLGHALQPVNP